MHVRPAPSASALCATDAQPPGCPPFFAFFHRCSCRLLCVLSVRVPSLCAPLPLRVPAGAPLRVHRPGGLQVWHPQHAPAVVPGPDQGRRQPGAGGGALPPGIHHHQGGRAWRHADVVAKVWVWVWVCGLLLACPACTQHAMPHASSRVAGGLLPGRGVAPNPSPRTRNPCPADCRSTSSGTRQC